MWVSLTKREISAIEKVINRSGKTEVVVKVESGKPVVVQVEKKKIV